MTSKNDYFGRDGHLNDIQTAICTDRLKDEREYLIPNETRSHLEECEFCRNSVLDIFSTTLSEEKRTDSESTIFKANKPPGRPISYGLFLRTAATFFVIAFMTGIFIIVNNDKPVSVKLINKDKAVGPIISDKTIKMNTPQTKEKQSTGQSDIPPVTTASHDPFKDNPNLEYMVDSPHRGRLINIISPEFRSIKKGKIVFMWENHIDKDLKLKILSNLNETLYTFKAKGSKVEFEGSLPPGLYYWKLEDSENLYHVGKFLIEE